MIYIRIPHFSTLQKLGQFPAFSRHRIEASDVFKMMGWEWTQALLCVFFKGEWWGVKCAQRDGISWRPTPSPAEADTCTSSSVGLIGDRWLRRISPLRCWRDRAANGSCCPIRVSELICGTLAPRTLNVRRAIRLLLQRTSVCNSLFVLDSLELKDIEYNGFCPVDSEPVRVSSSCDISLRFPAEQ